MTIKRIPIATALVLTLVVGVATATAGPTTTTAGPKMGQKNLVETAVAAGQFKTLASLLQKAGLAGTLEGKSISIRTSGGKVIAGGATVVKANVLASNGVIHVINKVLIP